MKKLFALFFLVFTSCSTTALNTSILDGPKCQLPCWNNLVPGETSYPEALTITSNMDGIDNDKTNILYAPWLIFSGRIWFYLYTDSSLAKLQTDGAIYFINDKMAALLLRRNIGKTFGEMVEMAGEPETIISLPFAGGGPVVTAILPSKGIMFEFYAKSDELRSETKIDAVIFFDPEHYESLLDVGMFSQGEYDAIETRKIMYEWKGYGSIEGLYPPRFP